MSLPAIGFFDSGVGGFSVLRHALHRLGGAPVIYYADSAHAPYGDRAAASVRQRSIDITRSLVDQGAIAVVVACNTATAVAVDALREEFEIPVIGMEPAVKPAANASRTGRVAVLATAATLASPRYAQLLQRFAGGVDVTACACTDWVELVEQGDLSSSAARRRVRRAIEPLRLGAIDTLVLGCTHFPFLQPLIEQEFGGRVNIIDPGPAVVDQLVRVLGTLETAMPSPCAALSPVTLQGSGCPQSLRRHYAVLVGGG